MFKARSFDVPRDKAQRSLDMPPADAQSIQRKSFVALEFRVVRGKEDDAAGILIAHGALGCEVISIKRPTPAGKKQKPELILRTYFERISASTIDRLTNQLTAAGMIAGASAPRPQAVVDPGWATMWQQRFTPVPVGERLLIVPPWYRNRNTKRLPIVIRPGQAFGTGHHPSTALTLRAIERLCTEQRIIDALDVGTGSGILSIAIDIDSAALVNAKENAQLNRVSGRIRFSMMPLANLSGRFGLVAANILGPTLIGLAADLKRKLRRGAYLVLAGILQREVDAVVRVYQDDLACVDVQHQGVWATLVFQK